MWLEAAIENSSAGASNCSESRIHPKLPLHVSMFLQRHVQCVIENELPFPDIRNATWNCQLFVVLLGNTDRATLRDAELITTYRNHFRPD
jgi:hypothetical protein